MSIGDFTYDAAARIPNLVSESADGGCYNWHTEPHRNSRYPRLTGLQVRKCEYIEGTDYTANLSISNPTNITRGIPESIKRQLILVKGTATHDGELEIKPAILKLSHRFD